MNLVEYYKRVRSHTDFICAPLKTEDYIPQPIIDVSPPKWHIAHTTWFFETFILKPHNKDYKEFDPIYNFLFNSYYENVGERVARQNRGFLTRPSVESVKAFRAYVDEKMIAFLDGGQFDDELKDLIVLGLNHEQQHQELLWSDIKYILGTQPTHPSYSESNPLPSHSTENGDWLSVEAGTYEIGFHGEGFCFDNELGVHKKYLDSYKIRKNPVTNGEYIKFIEDGGYTNVNLWHSEAWAWISANNIEGPLYWEQKGGKYYHYDFTGLVVVPENEPVCHVNYYEACAFAEWSGNRIPSEEEWEVASDNISWGDRWEWTQSAYLPYPGFSKAEGAVGEYNGKFMVSQMVLRGASSATPEGHERKTYRNFWHPWYQFQFSGIRLAK